ncbi:hypothetical protein SLEP1_g44269 [Rubroshorea leprosula]|uniref:Uncharacterized protein n=1 Tax=Rubroshorea leprosula TaxID=152421 RepID=A0AAV5LGX8_9ROSI|nr:hypothetical protein SLEP1_g44269 [Rubroshorea leprosula]
MEKDEATMRQWLLGSSWQFSFLSTPPQKKKPLKPATKYGPVQVTAFNSISQGILFTTTEASEYKRDEENEIQHETVTSRNERNK